MSLYSEFKDDPELALQVLFERPEATYFGTEPRVFVWTGGYSRDGVGYGSFKYVCKKDLADREYTVKWADYKPSIEFTDSWYNPDTYKWERK